MSEKIIELANKRFPDTKDDELAPLIKDKCIRNKQDVFIENA